MELVSLKASVHGLVQGVGFRAWALRRADALGLSGWVVNAPDGSVTVVLEGDRELVNEMLEALHKGPMLARVQRVDVEFQPYSGKLRGFEIKY